MAESLPQSIQELHDRLDAINGNNPLPSDRMVKELLASSVSEADLAAFVDFCDDQHTRVSISKTARFEIAIICWRQGHKTRPHTHLKHNCSAKVITGLCREARHDGGESVRNYTVGEAMGTEGGYCHTVESADGDMITLHVYSPPQT